MQFARLVGLFPLAIGLTVLGGLWLAPFGEFHSPPLFFRVFGSIIALAFVTFGAVALSGKALQPTHKVQELIQQTQREQQGSGPAGTATVGNYQCPGCAAPLADEADVSPLGDTKCAHCDRWFNIHGRTT